jgi:hypothetical protein
MIKISYDKVNEWRLQNDLSLDLVNYILKEYNFTDFDEDGNVIFVPNMEKDLEIFLDEVITSLSGESPEIPQYFAVRHTETIRSEFKEEYDEKFDVIAKFLVFLFQDKNYFHEDGEVLESTARKYRSFYEKQPNLPPFNETFLRVFKDRYNKLEYNVEENLIAFNVAASWTYYEEDIKPEFVRRLIKMSRSKERKKEVEEQQEE